ncbi:helicase associated domain-containing protein, partial [Candidatus Uhrbacteria bacterium]|nr:helicase associated domain-containing protein [Candidatus Uhrbacteria bacterium]
EERWGAMFALLKQFRREHPDRWPYKRERYEEALGHWCSNQRRQRRPGRGQLSPYRVQKLTAIGFPWCLR